MTVVLRALTAALILIAFTAAPMGCTAPQGKTDAEKRQSVLTMRTETLAQAFDQQPDLRDKVKNAEGYGVFSNSGAKILLLATGHGYGIVHDNKTGADTYMRMIEVGGGLGLGIKKFSGVFIFNTRAALTRFVDSGWEFGGDADAAAKAGKDSGGAVGADGTTGELDGLEVYQFTEAGLALSATVMGTKYFKDDDLNKK